MSSQPPNVETARQRHARVHGQVYIAEAYGTRRVKIGFSTNAIRRLQSVAVTCPVPLRLLVLLDGPPAAERELHARFKSAHCHGEWFDLDLDSKLIAFIRANLTDDPEFISSPRGTADALSPTFHRLSPFDL